MTATTTPLPARSAIFATLHPEQNRPHVHDYDVAGLRGVHRICVPHKVRDGDVCNVYAAHGHKFGAVWRISVPLTLARFHDQHEGYRDLLIYLDAENASLREASAAAVRRAELDHMVRGALRAVLTGTTAVMGRDSTEQAYCHIREASLALVREAFKALDAHIADAAGDLVLEGRTLLVDKVGALTKANPAQYEAAKLQGRMAADHHCATAGRLQWNGDDLEHAATVRDAYLANLGLY